MIVGPDGLIRHINRTYEEYAGREIVGTDSFMYMEEPYRSRQKEIFNRIIAGGPAESLEIRLVRENGIVVWFRSQLSPLIEDARVTGVVIFAQDITREKEAEAALQLSESKYRRIVNTAKDGIWTIDAEGLTTFVNPTMAEMLGYTPDEMLGKSFLDLMEPSTRPQGVQNLERRLAGVAEKHDSVLVHRNGTRVVTTMQTAPIIDEQDRITGALAVVHDVTALRRAEEERRQVERKMLEAQKLESLGVLAGGIAHDFNNMLAAIVGNVSLARLSAGASPEINGTLNAIERIAKRSSELTRQLLAYAGRGQLTREPVELNGLVREMADLLRVSVGRDTSFVIETGPDSFYIDGDATQLRQIVMNLITNAAEAIGNQPGVIRLRTEAMEPATGVPQRTRFGGPLSPGRHVLIEVSDSGCGMDPETVDRIFDPFFTTKFTGRGLGLAAVLGIVRDHSGGLDVDTERGRGTSFRIYMPRSAAGPARPVVLQASPEYGRDARQILVIDDEPLVRESTAKMLAKFGFSVLEADGGRPALDMIRERGKPPDLILLDLTMPGWDGVRTLSEIRTQGYRTVPVVVMTGYAERDVSRRFGEYPPAAVIQKPFTIDELFAQMNRVMACGGPG